MQWCQQTKLPCLFQLDIPNEPKVVPVLDETPWQWFGAFKDDPTWGNII